MTDKKLTTENAIEIARTYALMNHHLHSYLPTSHTDAEKWQPHEWVIDAIKFAFSLGK